MDRLQAMRVFSHVARLESFIAAASELNLSKASVSAYVSWLEEHIGARLLLRTTRTVRLTDDGRLFLERCQNLLLDVEDVETMFQSRPEDIKGRVRVDMSMGIAKNMLLPFLEKFHEIYPGIEVELSSRDYRVNLVEEGLDLVVRAGVLEDSELIARNLGELSIVNCVSPHYIKKHGEPKKISDLSRHYVVGYSNMRGVFDNTFEYLREGELKVVPMKSLISVNSTEAYLYGALNGLGIIQVPMTGIRGHLEKGELIEILPRLKVPSMPLSMLYPHRRHIPLRVKAFMDWFEGVVKELVR